MRQALTSLLVAGLALAGVRMAHPQGPPATSTIAQPAAIQMPGPQVLLMLVRTTLIALNQANFTGNYSVLHALATPALQAKVSPVQLGIAFTELREKHLDLSAVLLISPELSEAPRLPEFSRPRPSRSLSRPYSSRSGAYGGSTPSRCRRCPCRCHRNRRQCRRRRRRQPFPRRSANDDTDAGRKRPRAGLCGPEDSRR